jgi:hypothetical protein
LKEIWGGVLLKGKEGDFLLPDRGDKASPQKIGEGDLLLLK